MKREGQKARLLALLDILRRESDFEHPLPLPRLTALLEIRGFTADRKSLYDDIAVLRDFGYDIEWERNRGYYLASREFELPELKLLVDSVQSSRFITLKKSRELISKLEQLGSRHQASALHRQIYVAGRVKPLNEEIYYAIDAIQSAIAENCQISFQYADYNMRGQRVLRQDGRAYQVSPHALLRSEENYYLIAYHSPTGTLRHYRVDRMQQVSLLKSPREGQDIFASFDLADYDRIHFGMFSGQAERVTLRCQANMANVILDRFGRDTTLIPQEDGKSFTVTLQVAASPQFFGWLFGLSDGVELIEPEQLRREMARQLRQAADHYR